MVKNKDGGGDRKWWFLLGGLGVVILGLVIGIVVVLKSDRFTIDSREEALEYLTDALSSNDPNMFMRDSNYAITVAANDEVRAYIYLLRVGTLYNYDMDGSGEYINQMLVDAYIAESIYPTAESAYNISVCEDIMGNVERAEKYFNLAVERGLMERPGRG